MEKTRESFARFFEIVQKLRAPDGCPWDKEQTPYSLRSDFLEEAFEVIDAINRDDNENLREELGDMFLLVAMISYIGEQERRFTVSEVLDEVSDKLIRRHPHVFGDVQLDDAEKVVEQWHNIKDTIEGRASKKSVLDDVPPSLPPLEKAFRLQKKAAKKGFDWPDRETILEKIKEEVYEAEEVLRKEGQTEELEERLEAELGDLLFAVVNLARRYGVDPALALLRCNTSFTQRFAYVEEEMRSRGKDMKNEELQLMDELWEQAKEHLSGGKSQ